ncbi:cytochrome P450 9e2 [Anoplophora glabripennis]|uniref:cytochrome P450 9e2 n=1 Tax=Anoplophora glabripennis TaxID=217634 RepID=UPI000875345E|nr:cytochrome P450 9e2 [Anoplophora glabripennis]
MLVLATFFILCVAYVLLNYYNKLCYWKDKGIRYVTPLPIFGNSLPTLLQSVTYPEYIIDLYKQFPNERYCGTYQYGQPILLLRDLNLIKRILTKEFDTFSEHPQSSEPNEDTLWGKNLFAAKGETWRQLRKTISPMFTTSNIKSMFELIDKCATQLMKYLSEKNEDVIEIELMDLFKRYSSDTIASVSFGIECNSFKDRNNDFIRMGAELTNFGGLQKLKQLLYTVNPTIAKLLNVKMHPDNVSNFFRNLVKNSIRNREDKTAVRPDYIQYLIESRKGACKERENTQKVTKAEFDATKETNWDPINKKFASKLSDDDITAQAIDFFYGGFYSTASLMYFCVYELAINQEIQEKLRKEVDEALQDCGKINFDALVRMKYLDMTISETLRKWPTTTWIDRKSNKSIVIEPEDFNMERPLYLEVGTICWIPVFAIQRDPKYWPDPKKFEPERFSEDNLEKICNSSFLPFSAGPRSCVGSRFALLEAKLVIFYIISKFEVIPTEKSVSNKNPHLTSSSSFWFGFKKR